MENLYLQTIGQQILDRNPTFHLIPTALHWIRKHPKPFLLAVTLVIVAGAIIPIQASPGWAWGVHSQPLEIEM